MLLHARWEVQMLLQNLVHLFVHSLDVKVGAIPLWVKKYPSMFVLLHNLHVDDMKAILFWAIVWRTLMCRLKASSCSCLGSRNLNPNPRIVCFGSQVLRAQLLPQLLQLDRYGCTMITCTLIGCCCTSCKGVIMQLVVN
jgi:hypothetical protein